MVKLVVAEAESDALQRWLLEQPEPTLVSSVLARTELRSLDAIHLASARRLGPTLVAFVAYDTRLVEAAEALRCSVVRPGVEQPSVG